MKQRLFKVWNTIAKPCKRFWSWYKGLYIKAPWWKKLCVGIVTFIAAVIFYCFAVVFNFLWLFGSSPSLNEILHPRTPEASILYSADGKEIGKYFSENRQAVPYDSIAPCFFDALIVTEDERFYKHHGVDFVGLFAAAKDAAQGHARGASTISQQLVKNMFRVRTKYGTGLLGNIPGLRIIIQKSKEMLIATSVELLTSKENILEMYANTVDYGYNSFGIKTAARTYFDTTPSHLKIEEAAVLVGLLKATYGYNPKSNPEKALSRRNQVLDNLYTHGKITKAERDSLQALPINLKFHVETPYDGQALYFRQAVADEIRRVLPEYDLYGDGLRIYSTVDPRMQQMAEEAVWEKMREINGYFKSDWGNSEPWTDSKQTTIPNYLAKKIKQTDSYRQLLSRFPDSPDSIDYYLNLPHEVHLFDFNGKVCEKHRKKGHDAVISTLDSLNYMLRFMHTGMVAIEPSTGYVKAYVGDIDFQTWNYDKAAAAHQPGSTFKLFVYATGLERGMTPDSKVLDAPVAVPLPMGGCWCPHNAGGGYSYRGVPLHNAFARSLNTVAVRIGQEVGIPRVIKTAHAMGVKRRLAYSPAIALGASDVSVTEMVNGYATVANGGQHMPATCIMRIVDRDGNEVYKAPSEPTRAISPKTAYYMQQLLHAGTVEGGGTSLRLNSYIGHHRSQLDYGAKTGTTNHQCDGWFMCATPNLAVGAWVGGEYHDIHFRSGALGQGARTALPVVASFLQKVMDDPKLQKKYLKKYPQPDFELDPQDQYEWGGNWSARREVRLDDDFMSADALDDVMFDDFDDASSLGAGSHVEVVE